MGWLKKKIKQLGKGIKKIGKKIGGAFKKILKPFAKIFNKLGPLGSIALMMLLPGLGTLIAGWGATLVGGTSVLGQLAGYAVRFVGNAINFVATAPQKIFQTITGGISSAWNAMLGRPATGGTFLSGTGMFTDTSSLIGKEAWQAELVNTGAPDSWWRSFTNDMKNVWGNRGTVGADNLFTATSGTGGNLWDVSKIGVEANKKLAAQWSGPQGFKQDIKNLFTPTKGTRLTEANAATTITDPQALQTFMDKGTVKFNNITYNLDREGFFGNIRDVVGGTTGKIGDITIPGIGDVSDIASVTSMGIGAYSTLAQYGVVGSEDDPYGIGGGMTIRAEEQLYGGDQGGMYNITPPTWSYDYNNSFAQNQQDSRNAWNTAYGLPEGFDSASMGGYGFGYDQWFMQTMGFAPIRY